MSKYRIKGSDRCEALTMSEAKKLELLPLTMAFGEAELSQFSGILRDLERGKIQHAVVRVSPLRYEIWRTKEGFLFGGVDDRKEGFVGVNIPRSIADAFRAFLRDNGFMTRSGGYASVSPFFRSIINGEWKRVAITDKPIMEHPRIVGGDYTTIAVSREVASMINAVIDAGKFKSRIALFHDFAQPGHWFRKEAA